MNSEPLEESYFKWLVAQVVDVRQKSTKKSCWLVLRQLHSTRYFWNVRNDDNREADGKELRFQFLEGEDLNGWDFDEGCSFLEMLIALSRRCAFQTENISPTEWFWHLMNNVGLGITDWQYEEQRMEMYVDQVLQMVNNRTYDRNGRGGLFPLRDPEVDQRKVELWYQLNYYLIERS